MYSNSTLSSDIINITHLPNNQETNVHLKTITMYSEIIPMYSNSTLSSEIINITHLPNNQEIHVHLKTPWNDRRCKNPTFRGRLSGPYLALIKWEHDSIFASPNKTNDIIVGRYQVPSAGVYFIEIVVLLCESIKYQSNFVSQCLEDSRKNRITEIGASINILPPNTKLMTSSEFPLGFWKWKGDIEENPKKPYIPLLFRFQPDGCFESTSIECKESASRDRFKDYDFVWNDLSTEDSMKLKRTRTGDLTQFQGKSETTVCFAGKSHSRGIVNVMNWLNISQSIKVEYFPTLFTRPGQGRDLDEEFRKIKTEKHCNITVLAIGQWAASYVGKIPFLMHEWDYIMRKVINSIKLGGSYPIIRLLHMQPVTQRHTCCPPFDWRVQALSGYNEILVKIGREMDIPIIDTDFIIAPMSDSYIDFMHPKNKLSWIECNHIMRGLMNLTGVL